MRHTTSPARLLSLRMSFERLAQLLQRKRPGGRHLQRRFGVGHHGRQRLVDFVRERSGERVEHGHAAQVRELIAQSSRLRFGVFAVRDVQASREHTRLAAER